MNLIKEFHKLFEEKSKMIMHSSKYYYINKGKKGSDRLKITCSRKGIEKKLSKVTWEDYFTELFVEDDYKNLCEFAADKKIRTVVIKLLKTEDLR